MLQGKSQIQFTHDPNHLQTKENKIASNSLGTDPYLGGLGGVKLVEERVLSRDLILLHGRKRFAAHQKVRACDLPPAHGLHERGPLELAVGLDGPRLLLDEAVQKDAEREVAQRVAVIELQQPENLPLIDFRWQFNSKNRIDEQMVELQGSEKFQTDKDDV
jgi:hypothetical protein